MYIYKESDEFRAKAIFYAGTVFCSPIALEALALLRREADFNLLCICLDLLSLRIGLKIIDRAYEIMKSRDEKKCKE